MMIKVSCINFKLGYFLFVVLIFPTGCLLSPPFFFREGFTNPLNRLVSRMMSNSYGDRWSWLMWGGSWVVAEVQRGLSPSLSRWWNWMGKQQSRLHLPAQCGACIAWGCQCPMHLVEGGGSWLLQSLGARAEATARGRGITWGTFSSVACPQHQPQAGLVSS